MENNLIDDLFESNLNIPYDLRFLNVAQEWVTSTTTLAGGNKAEIYALCIALEETLHFIVDAYPEAGTEEFVNVSFKLHKDGNAEITVSNAGPPMQLAKIPNYDPQKPQESEFDGLWYHLAREVVDVLEFKNHSMDGWRIVIQKHLDDISFTKISNKDKGQSSKPVSEFKTHFATSEDAAELVNLTYDIYRYSYPVPEFYDEDKLRHALEQGEIVSIVVTADDIIVGNLSISMPTDSSKSAYMGSLMVKREFRKSQVISNILEATEQFMTVNKHNMDIYDGTTVTVHPASQKVTARIGFQPLALLLSIGTSVDYRGMVEEETKRETFLHCVYFTKSPELTTIYLPKKHQEVMLSLLLQAGCHAELSSEVLPPIKQTTSFSVKEDSVERNAYLTLTAFGSDWGPKLRKKLFSLSSEGFKTIIVLIPVWNPLPPDIDQSMASLNAVFCGIKPISAKKFFMVYSVLTGPVNFQEINIYNPLAQKLKAHVHQLYTEILAE